jgi:hypothetical protein
VTTAAAAAPARINAAMEMLWEWEASAPDWTSDDPAGGTVSIGLDTDSGTAAAASKTWITISVQLIFEGDQHAFEWFNVN